MLDRWLVGQVTARQSHARLVADSIGVQHISRGSVNPDIDRSTPDCLPHEMWHLGCSTQPCLVLFWATGVALLGVARLTG